MGYTLSEIISEYLIEIGSGQTNQFSRYYQYGVSFLRRTNLDTSGFPKIVELEISHHDTADLPLDYIQYTKIALCHCGILYPLGLNNNICLDKNYDECGKEISGCNCNNSPCNCAGGNGVGRAIGSGFGFGFGYPLGVADHYTNGESTGRYFGASSGINLLGEYRIDKNNNQIKFSGLSRTCTVAMEYLADIDAQDSDFTVHPYMLEALKSYIQWMYKVRSSKPLGEQEMAHNIFKIENRNMKHRFMSSTMNEFQQAMLSNQQQTPKLG